MPSELEEVKADLKECIKTTTENSLAIKELITLSSQSTKDTDKLVKHLDKLLPIHERVNGVSDRVESLEKDASDGIKPKTLKEMLTWSTLVIIGFGTWATIMIFALDKTITLNSEKQTLKNSKFEKKINDLNEKTQDNENQITYLKGRIK